MNKGRKKEREETFILIFLNCKIKVLFITGCNSACLSMSLFFGNFRYMPRYYCVVTFAYVHVHMSVSIKFPHLGTS